MLKSLIVDGDEIARNRFENLINKSTLNVEVFSSTSLCEAHNYLKYHKFNLVFLELNFIDGNAADLIKSFTLHTPEANCIVITTDSNSQNIFATLRVGAYGYVLKQQSDDELIHILNGILNGIPPLSPSVTRKIVHHFNNSCTELKNTGLTNKEKEVLTLIAKGISRSDTANLLNITDNTAASYIKSIYQKLGISTRAEAAQEAIRIGLVGTY